MSCCDERAEKRPFKEYKMPELLSAPRKHENFPDRRAQYQAVCELLEFSEFHITHVFCKHSKISPRNFSVVRHHKPAIWGGSPLCVEELIMAKRGRPSGVTSWWRNPNNIAAHHAQALMELWLAGAPVVEIRVMLSSLAGRPEYQGNLAAEQPRTPTHTARSVCISARQRILARQSAHARRRPALRENRPLYSVPRRRPAAVDERAPPLVDQRAIGRRPVDIRRCGSNKGRVGGDHQRGSKGFYIARARCRKEFQRRLAIQGFSHTATAEILGRTTVMQCSAASPF